MTTAGVENAAGPGLEADSLPGPELCRRLLETMSLMRAVEDRLSAMYKRGELPGTCFTGHGHEAIAVGTAAALRPDDVLAPLHRDVGAYLWRGTEPWEVFASFLGRAASATGGRDTAFHYGRWDRRILNGVDMVADNYPVAAGIAFALRYRGEDRVAIAYCGDGATSRGDFHEALNIAAVMRLPVVYVVENNQYAYSTPLERQMASDGVACRAAGYGIPGQRRDGNDVVAVLDATRAAVARAREGGGPTLLEMVTMRMHGHSEHDPADYVPRELLEAWAARDPIAAFQHRLVGAGILDDAEADRIREEARARAVAESERALALPLPDPATVAEGVYA
jgi:pyruvate dehydrogenase E1 component alpha subunit